MKERSSLHGLWQSWEEEQCNICQDERRDDSRIAVVEDLRDLRPSKEPGISVDGTTCWGASSVPWTAWVRRISG